MELTLVKNQANNLEEYFEEFRDSHSWSTKIEETIKLINFIKDEVSGPPQWYVISHLVLVLIVKNGHYYGRATDIKLTTWMRDGVYYFSKLGPSDTKNTVSFKDSLSAKKYLEEYFDE